MYRRPKFLEVLLAIRREMAVEADYDVDLFAEMARTGTGKAGKAESPPLNRTSGPAESDTEPVHLTTSSGA